LPVLSSPIAAQLMTPKSPNMTVKQNLLFIIPSVLT
jgi:hypothetical protein